MKRMILTLVTLCSLGLNAQSLSPSLMVKENGVSRPLKVSKVKAEVVIHGYIAETKMTMTFCNPTNRVLEGQLYFPLPEGSTVAGYGLDINGKMVDGVVVEKAKGREVFEKIVRQNIDPGLVEWTKGNNFKTRVYPIPQNGTRTVMVRYISEISTINSASIFRLPLNFKEKLDEFSIRLEVIRPASAPKIKKSGLANLEFTSWKENYGIEKTFTDLSLTEDLVIDLPQVEKKSIVVEKERGETYFVINCFPEVINSNSATKLSTVTIFWDASHSRAKVDHEREFAFLRSFVKKQENLSVNLIVFRNESEDVESFPINGGNCEDLINFLKKLPYDGATQIGSLKVPENRSDCCFLFSDGLSNFGKDKPKINVPVYSFSGANSSNHSFLRHISQLTGGQYFNLKKVTDEQIVSAIGKSPYQFMNAEINGASAESCYPSMATPVQNRFAFTGKLVGEIAKVKLNFGQDGKVSETLTYEIKASDAIDGKVLRTYYGQKMIDELLIFPKLNSEKMVEAGKSYGLVTPGTSLIVLDNINQYVEHRIEPPASMPKWQEIYKKRIAAIDSAQRAKMGGKIDRLVSMWKEVCSWHKQDFKLVKKYKGKPQLMDDEFSDDEGDDFGDEGIVAGAPPMDDFPIVGEMEEEFEDSEEGFDDEFSDEGGDDDFDDYGEAPVPLVTGSGTITASMWEPCAPAKLKRISNGIPSSSISIKAWTPDTPYLKAMLAAGDQAYDVYLSQKEEYGNSPAFFLDCSDFFIKQKDEKIAIRVLSNIAELELENAALLRVLAHRLVQVGKLELAIGLFEEVLKMREEEPQSYRDLALAFALTKEYQRAIDLLYQAVLKDWNRFFEIEKIMLVEINRIIAKAEHENVEVSNIDHRLKKLIDVDVRIVMNWDADNTDMDLWVTEPSGEKCYYGHNRTVNGGRMSRDFTQGYGPEEYMTKIGRDGKYKIQANYYGSSSQKLIGAVTVQAEVYTNYGRPNEKRQTLTFRLTKGKEVVTIGEIMFGDSSEIKATDSVNYQIKAGDTLFSIARKELGDGNRWEEIVALNQNLNPNSLKVGAIIKLPIN